MPYMPVMTVSEPASDASLAAAWVRGDQAAATEIVRRHAGPMARYLYSSGAPPGDIDDLVQESLFRAFRRLETWRGEASLRSWLCCIAGNLLKDEHRRHGKRRMVSIDDHPVMASSDPHADVAATEAESRLRAGLADLPRLQREVFLMRAQQGCDYDDIARTLGTTPGAARVHYHHAVRRLKGILA
jgi:RNA polymerase sigma-70 factor, ECF subfamily